MISNGEDVNKGLYFYENIFKFYINYLKLNDIGMISEVIQKDISNQILFDPK